MKKEQVLKSKLNVRRTEREIEFIKDFFRMELAKKLDLQRASSPLYVKSGSGLNDGLCGVEKAVSFKAKGISEPLEIVHSLAKWKRLALKEYGFEVGKGIYTNMNAIRRDEVLDEIHSFYVDQWDWEKIIPDGKRDVEYLYETVENIYTILYMTEQSVLNRNCELGDSVLPDEITFVHTEELLKLYPKLSPKERENRICKDRKAVFLRGIGHKLLDGKKHDDRAADYDDWSSLGEDGLKGLNGDILVWNPVLQSSFELSSMGIRVSPESLIAQLAIRQEMFKTDLPFHQELLAGSLPQTIGGGIGQSRLCQFFLRKEHIGEVQCSIWTDEIKEKCKLQGIQLL